MKFSWILILFFLTESTNAADIQVGVFNGRSIITIVGVINKDDDVTFRQLAASSPGGSVVVLNSEGGLVEPALAIGRAIRLKGLATVVASDTLCASACALIWLAGIDRYMSIRSHIGFHASYRFVDGRAKESGVSNALIGAYLNQLNLPEGAIVFVTTAPPEGMEWLTAETASSTGIAFRSLDDGSPGQAPQKVNEIYDPLKTVTAFYSALSMADGNTAAALVIPDKRGKGPFNEANIHAFFGNLDKPLRLRGTNLKENDIVEVSYDYIKAGGAACNGKADVRTTYAFGKTLITSIKALSGC